jgi:hypothetical protein
MKKMVIALSVAMFALLLSVLPAITRPAPLDQSLRNCNTYSYVSSVTPSSLRISGGVKCNVDKLISLGVQVRRNRRVIYKKGYSWDSNACTLRQCSIGYTASNSPGQQEFEMVVIATLGYPVAGGAANKGGIGGRAETLVDTYRYYE